MNIFGEILRDMEDEKTRRRRRREDIVSRLVLAAIFVTLAYFTYPGDQIADRSLATLTLREIAGLIGAAGFFFLAIRMLIAKP